MGSRAPRSKSASVARPTPAADASSVCDQASRPRAARHCAGESRKAELINFVDTPDAIHYVWAKRSSMSSDTPPVNGATEG